LARYGREIERCRAATGDESLSMSERWGAQMGEVDWMVAKQIAEEERSPMKRNAATTAEVQIEQWPIDRLLPYARNPRKNDHVVEQMAASIKEFGFKIPILARSDGTVVDGHLRLKAAQLLTLASVPVILCDEWTDAQVKAFRLLVNRSVTWADWDHDLLTLELEDLKIFDFDLDLTGFSSVELLNLVGDSPTAPDGTDGNWRGMPDFHQDDLTSYQSILVHFPDEESRIKFAELVGQSLTEKTRSIWYPKAEITRMVDQHFVSAEAAK
jgi:hypothetical protein